MKYSIVVVGYNRPDSMRRLLESLCCASYEVSCDLVISLDYGTRQEELLKIAENVKWMHGEKKIRKFQSAQGLRQHILQCGDLTNEYDAVVVMEDDLVVAENFFQYVIEAVEFYNNNDLIAGISLYTHHTNPGNGRAFEAQFNGYDAYLMQYAQSWGQCWTRKMWNAFRNWYDEQVEDIALDGVVPNYVVGWNKQSWLKYYIRYTAEKGLFYVYPYFSLTTNSSEIGEHNKHNSTAYQVPLSTGKMQGYRFPEVEDAVKYDAYFERIFEEPIDGCYGNILLDLYGLRKHFGNADTLISTQKLNYKILREIELKYRPHELNCLRQEEGKGIYVYDLKELCVTKKKLGYCRLEERLRIAQYDLKAESPRLTLLHGLNGVKENVKRRFCKKP